MKSTELLDNKPQGERRFTCSFTPLPRLYYLMNLHDRSLFGFLYAEGGLVYYKLSPLKTPYILQYLVGLNLNTQPPAYLHIPNSWSAFNLSLYANPDYLDSIWEWRDSQPVQLTIPPSLPYVIEKYTQLNAQLTTSPNSIPITYANDYWTLKL